MASVTSLHCYPIKACRGIDLDEGVVERRGFRHDRRFMVVDADGRFRSQRAYPDLARVGTLLEGDELLVAEVDEIGELHLELAEAGIGSELDIEVRAYAGRAIDQGDESAEFFTELLGSPSRLVYMPDAEHRTLNPEFRASDEDAIGFHDGYPFLITSQASLDQLQLEMDEHVPMERFRANVVIADAEPWDEDSWRSLRVGNVELAIAKACTRCKVTTTDQHTGERFREPLRTLGRLRRTGEGVTFGVYAIPLETGGTIRAGDAVEIDRR